MSSLIQLDVARKEEMADIVNMLKYRYKDEGYVFGTKFSLINSSSQLTYLDQCLRVWLFPIN